MAGMTNPEAFSRVLIDKALTDSGWTLTDPKQVRFELHGSSGRADYVLLGKYGPLCVVEAKKEDADPYDAKEQAPYPACSFRCEERQGLQRNCPFSDVPRGDRRWCGLLGVPENEDPFRGEEVVPDGDSKATGYLDFRDRFREAEMVLFYAKKEIMLINMPKDRGDWPEEKLVDEGNRWRGEKRNNEGRRR